jgi:hypothetical protein
MHFLTFADVGQFSPGHGSPTPRPAAAPGAPETDERRIATLLSTFPPPAGPGTRDLRRAVRDHVLAERARGVLVERVIIALKRRILETVPQPRGETFRDTLVTRVVTWCIHDYFHLPLEYQPLCRPTDGLDGA